MNNNPMENERRSLSEALHEEEKIREIERKRTLERKTVRTNKLSNKERLDIIKIWYPKAYETIMGFFPYFVKSPDAYPELVLTTVNGLLINMIDAEDQKFLLLK